VTNFASGVRSDAACCASAFASARFASALSFSFALLALALFAPELAFWASRRAASPTASSPQTATNMNVTATVPAFLITLIVDSGQ
jgi:hypothetical protein